MTRLQRSVMVAVMIAATGGCSDFLTAEGITGDPNAPTSATRDQLFVGFQASQFNQQEGSVALLSCLYMQQCSGTANFVQEWDNYNASAEETDANFVGIYTGGGLVDLRAVQASAE